MAPISTLLLEFVTKTSKQYLPRSMHNLQRHDTIFQFDWHNSALASKYDQNAFG